MFTLNELMFIPFKSIITYLVFKLSIILPAIDDCINLIIPNNFPEGHIEEDSDQILERIIYFIIS